MNDQLWCVYFEGPNDFIAATSKEAAEREALAINAYAAARSEQGAGGASGRAVAKEWPFTREAHARAVEADWADVQRMPHRSSSLNKGGSSLPNFFKSVARRFR